MTHNRCGVIRFGVGISAVHDMVGPTDAVSNAIICSPAEGGIGQYDMVGYTVEVCEQAEQGLQCVSGGVAVAAVAALCCVCA